MTRIHTTTGGDTAPGRQQDEGTILIMVLVMMVIGSLIILPLMVYTMSVFRAGGVQTDKSESVELARGGTWVALSFEEELYDKCNGTVNLSKALGPNVETFCSLVDDSRLRPAAEIPYHVTSIRSDAGLPAVITGNPAIATYTENRTDIDPNDWDKWMDNPDWSTDSTQNTVWVPELPVRSTLGGGNRDTFLSFVPTCRIFFPGTFQNPITISDTAYFTSGVYYFTEPITLEKGADVVVGNGTELGCTSDFEAVAEADQVPNPLNISGLGGTFVLGDNARIIVDEDNGPGTDIKFTMNQRYVSPEETSVAASSNVSIISVNGTHAPLVGAEALGDELNVPGVIRVPPSTVGTGDPVSPQAVDEGYTPSNLTNKAYAPDAPTNIVGTDWQFDADPDPCCDGPAWDEGRLHVTWDAPNENGSPITGYVAKDMYSGKECSPPAPTLPDTTIQTACTIVDLDQPFGERSEIVVTATNAMGSTSSPVVLGPRVDLWAGGGESPDTQVASAPQNPAISVVYSDGNEISWDPPATVGTWPVSGYRVTATPVPAGPPIVSCEAWWDETSCILRASDGFVGNGSVQYVIDVVAIQQEQPPYLEYAAPSATILPSPTPTFFGGPTPAPFQTPTPWTGLRIPDPILDLRATNNATPIDIWVAGYISVPQGRIAIDVNNTAGSEVELTGGVVAGEVSVNPAGEPALLRVELDNPIAQKRVRIETTVAGDYNAKSVAIVQVNRSGSIAVNAWYVQ